MFNLPKWALIRIWLKYLTGYCPSPIPFSQFQFNNNLMAPLKCTCREQGRKSAALNETKTMWGLSLRSASWLFVSFPALEPGPLGPSPSSRPSGLHELHNNWSNIVSGSRHHLISQICISEWKPQNDVRTTMWNCPFYIAPPPADFDLHFFGLCVPILFIEIDAYLQTINMFLLKSSLNESVHGCIPKLCPQIANQWLLINPVWC